MAERKMLLMHTVPLGDAKRLCRALRQAGIPTKNPSVAHLRRIVAGTRERFKHTSANPPRTSVARPHSGTPAKTACHNLPGPFATGARRPRVRRPRSLRRGRCVVPSPTTPRPQRIGRTAPRYTDTPLPLRPHRVCNLAVAAPPRPRKTGRAVCLITDTPIPPRPRSPQPRCCWLPINTAARLSCGAV